MRHYIVILTLFIGAAVFGQTKDRRAELDIQGRVNEISISPDEKIWLATATGNIYYTKSIDSNWHSGIPIFQSTDELGLDRPHLERISFFNMDTAIMTGYISVNKKESKKNGLYLTTDGGNSWNILDFGGDSWIYNVFVDKNGNAWMGGSSGDIFYSNDFGQHWVKLNSPYNSFSRMHSIFMLNSNEGISGALHNDIYTTEDNWKSNKKVITPFDQNKYTTETGYSDDRIEKILLWNNYIVVNQNGHIFYSDAINIDWKPFAVKLVDFELDKESKTLFGVTDSLRILSFSTPTEFQLLTSKRLSDYPIDIKVTNHSLYLVCNGYEVYKANEKGLTKNIPYTTDKSISELAIIKQSANLTWGINGNQIYLAENNKHDWYRENALEFGIADFTLLSDSLAILWDGIKSNYLYSLYDHTPKIYFPDNPIKLFLASAMQSLSVNSGSRGCFHNINSKVVYERTDDSTFSTSSSSLNENQDEKSSIFKNKISSKQLSVVLNSINSNPAKIPTLKDFRITEKDKKNYLSLVDKQIKSKKTDYPSSRKKVNKVFYYSIPGILDTLNSSIINNILDQPENVWSTTSNWFTIQIANQNNDTLNISRNYYASTLPWNLPWKFEYKGLNFNCYDIELSKFINSCIPDNFMDKEVFDNRILIMQIADYLNNKP